MSLAVICDPAKRSLRRVFDLPAMFMRDLLAKKPAGLREVGLGFLNEVTDEALSFALTHLSKAGLEAVTIECLPAHHAQVLTAALTALPKVARVTVTCRAWSHPDVYALIESGARCASSCASASHLS